MGLVEISTGTFCEGQTGLDKLSVGAGGIGQNSLVEQARVGLKKHPLTPLDWTKKET